MDKPPKPPKKPAQPQSAPGPGNSNSSSHKCPNLPLPVQSKLQMSKSNTVGPKSRIERVDLSRDRDRNDYVKVGPQDYRNLHRLHESVTKAPPVPTIGHTKHTYSYSKGEQPKLSFLSKGGDTACLVEKMSSDYDDEWMDDLPSPSTLLGQKKCAETTTPKDPAKAADTLVFDGDISDMEADMLGLSDATISKGSSKDQIEGAALSGHREFSDADIFNENEDVVWDLPALSPPTQFRDEIQKQDKNERLFLSTDNPDKPTAMPMKRKTTASSDVEVSTTPGSLVLKKSKTDDLKIDSQQPSIDGSQASPKDAQPPYTTTLEDQAPSPAPAPKIKPGYPAWVYDLDPAFVAEYEDYVEFV